ncbi:4Fe-4S binding protein [Citrobacter rodentium NBRC 105723 = DSM 16636]|uniref:Polyferredoxin n=2 Tax=Citrobacter rodentium TaxID=67825 RepID=D2TPX0_CITRI|nr:4Fe-4S binding protein [Citrobacter rodentium]KIQ50420.1 hypothetical protein TA05_15795 [Citrobacter rodentium]UHO32795.1 4Fe-4S binding protein [Citrobacter rodentium NBRC 105723 = DSM 16636]CBG90157.1 putative polyferredoxin [Citrobacter rodentium ICC168]HAT8034476.1 ferredoxin [Citrobacter rodentium]
MKTPAPPGVGASCVRQHFPRHTCDACRQACPVGAISFTANAATLDSERCIRCGHCAFACPVDALENVPTARRPFRHGMLVAPFTAQAASVDELLMWHLQYGIRALEIEPDAHPAWVLAVAALNIQLNALGEPQWQLIPPTTKPVNVFRRHLLHVSEEKVQTASVDASQRVRRSGMPHVQEHAVLLDAVNCVLCGACERVCQQQVIKIDELALRTDAARCTGCNNCAVVCPTKAIATKAVAGVSQPATFTFTRKVCPDCRRTFATFTAEDKRCPICQRHEYGMRGR